MLLFLVKLAKDSSSFWRISLRLGELEPSRFSKSFLRSIIFRILLISIKISLLNIEVTLITKNHLLETIKIVLKSHRKTISHNKIMVTLKTQFNQLIFQKIKNLKAEKESKIRNGHNLY